MFLKIFFDASYKHETNLAGISIIIKNKKGEVILNSSKKILCKSSSEAEFRALNKAISFINNRQFKNLIPQKCNLNIYGDCQSLIEISRLFRHMKGIDKGLMINYLKEIKTLKKNNYVSFRWIRRNENKEADRESRCVLLDM